VSAYTPHTPADVAAMLATIGAGSIDALVAHVPEPLRRRAAVGLPDGLTEPALRRVMADLAARNTGIAESAVFVGAGAYAHLAPGVVNHVLLRSEFATAYTPYQPEVSQGTLQAIFEFQTFSAMLLGLDVANASMYDGASATAEAVLMARRLVPGRRTVLVSRGVHPQYREVVATYVQGLPDVRLVDVPLDGAGRTDAAALARLAGDDTLCVVLGYPNVLGVIEDVAPIARVVHDAGGLVITATPEPLALALVRSPGACGADIAVAEGQSLGLPVSFGGPGAGLFATRDAHVRAMPGRIVGETVDARGQRGYVLTLATREQHIRRQKATSNICTNQGLCTLAITVYLSALGRDGLRRVADANYQRAHAVAARLEAAGVPRVGGAPFFNEFAVYAPDVAADWERHVEREALVPGYPVGRWLPEHEGALLVCVTEVHDDAAIERLVSFLASACRAVRARTG
jgi:glycine cleavage system P protein (glycine dehydrogenase) subunit 1